MSDERFTPEEIEEMMHFESKPGAEIIAEGLTGVWKDGAPPTELDTLRAELAAANKKLDDIKWVCANAVALSSSFSAKYFWLIERLNRILNSDTKPTG